jgi:hypothetical protein
MPPPPNKMEQFHTLSLAYGALNRHIEDRRLSVSVKEYVPAVIRALRNVAKESVDKTFNEQASLVADELESLGIEEITASDVEQVWQKYDIKKLMKRASMIFAPFVMIKLIAAKGPNITEVDWKRIYKCLEYNTLMINKQREDGKELEIDPRCEYLLRHSEEIIRGQGGNLKHIMSYPIEYVATPVMAPPPSKFTDPRSSDHSKLELFNDLCELYAFSLLAREWVSQGDKKLNALEYSLTVTNVTIILPMRCRYINNSNKDISRHLATIYYGIQAFIADPRNRSALTGAEPELFTLAYHSCIEAEDIMARYAQTNINYNKAKREQEEEVGIDDLPLQMNTNVPIEVAGKHHHKEKGKKKHKDSDHDESSSSSSSESEEEEEQHKKKKKKQKVKFKKHGKHRS